MTVNKKMSIGEVLTLDRGTARIFMEFGMHCLGCPHATAEPIEDACAAHGSGVRGFDKRLLFAWKAPGESVDASPEILCRGRQAR